MINRQGASYLHRNDASHPICFLKTLIQHEQVKQFLSNHGCTLDEEGTQGPECTIHFPPGTTRTELYPRTYQTRFRLLLPDRTELREVDIRAERNQLQIVLDTLPDREKDELLRGMDEGE